VRVDRERPNCVGVFMLDYMILMEIRVGDSGSFFACKLACIGGILQADPSERVSDLTMRASCKTLIAASGLDPSEYATHLSKRGGALMALQAGLSTAQIQELGRWSSSAMVSRYAKGEDLVHQERPRWRSRHRLASSTVWGSSFASLILWSTFCLTGLVVVLCGGSGCDVLRTLPGFLVCIV
jgi:hypothetical protein